MSEPGLEAQLEEMTAELLDRYEELNLMYDLGGSLASVFDPERICAIVVEKASDAIGTAQALVALNGERGCELVASRGGAALDPDGVTEHVAATGRELLLHEDDPGPAGRPRAERRPLLSVPLLPPGDAVPLGALTLAAKPDGARFTAGDAKLATAVATQLAAALYTSRLVESLRAAEAVRREVEIAAGIQRALLPERPPDLPGAELAALCVPAANVGGDYYDLLVDEEGRLSVVIADVAGHSVGSALMMAMARSVLRRELASDADPAAVLRATNTALFDDLARAGLFITAFCAQFDPASGALEYANAGHNPPLLRRAANGETRELDADGVALGILRDAEFEHGSAALGPGDVVLLYTDGVTEAAGADGQFGEERLRAAIGDMPAGELVDAVYAAVRAYAGDARGDDVTLVALRAEAAH
jgi:serine phosphatase RsbU (regulator of sigma subunit)